MSSSSDIGRSKRHVDTKGENTPRAVLLPGDPSRVPLIGEGWDAYNEVSFEREFRLAKGTYRGAPIGACSTGIGGPSAEIALLELAETGTNDFIRVGTCGALQSHIEPGDVVIQHGAVRLSGAVDAYVGREYPSVADHAVTSALIAACDELGQTYHIGLTASVDSFYAGQANPVPGGHSLGGNPNIAHELSQRRVATFEMEAATLLALGTLFGLRVGSICAVGSNRITNRRTANIEPTVRRVCEIASLAAIRLGQV